MGIIKVVVPALLHLLCIIIVLLTLLSPVPYHTSSISLVYISPAAMSGGNSGADSASGVPRPSTTTSAPLHGADPSMPGSSVPDVFSSVSTSPQSVEGAPDDTGAARLASPARATETSHAPLSTAAGPISNFPSLQSLSADRAAARDAPAAAPERARRADPAAAAAAPPAAAARSPPPLAHHSLHARTEDNSSALTSSAAVSLTNIGFSVGLLGSCFFDKKGDAQCTPSSMQPKMNNTWLAKTPGVEQDTATLIKSLTAEPSLVLVAFLVVAVTATIPARRLHLGVVGTVERSRLELQTPRMFHILRAATYAQDAAAIALFLVAVALRVQVSRANDGFNRANAHRPLGPEAMAQALPDSAPLVLHADTGTAFSCLCVSAVIFILLDWIERRRLRRERNDAVWSERRRGDVDVEKEEPGSWRRTLLQRPLHAVLAPEPRMTISRPIPTYPPPLGGVSPSSFPEYHKEDPWEGHACRRIAAHRPIIA
ncbi:hypothetical protein MSPP1_003569 [Malassezia sp. CBS 17886]|nr:hypothetical protein MSPP1_003569 [Malassezia sp. CBS 17886]